MDTGRAEEDQNNVQRYRKSHRGTRSYKPRDEGYHYGSLPYLKESHYVDAKECWDSTPGRND